ncbi:hypothetical protein BLN97_10940 [Bradyrhizobium elkanii]|nr:hypothetical protein BLN97_10940 [Bradyrhizobium elkanii]
MIDDEPYGSQTVAASSLMWGDFNFDVADPQHALIDLSGRHGLNYRDEDRRSSRPRARRLAVSTTARNGPMGPIVATSFS